MRSLLAGIAFLTRLPVGRLISFDAGDVVRSAGWFPLVGAMLGAACGGAAWLLREHVPPAMVAILMVALDAVLTGALHFDGLADAADGFGGGKDRDDILRIMRDHAIGSYGATALILLVALKVTAYALLLTTANWFYCVALTPVLGRWALVLLTGALPYARPSPSVVSGMRWPATVCGTAIAAVLVAATRYPRAWAAAAAVLVATGCLGFYSRRRIGGITGDVLGANLQLSECAALLAFLWAGLR
jgi:cobalamin 5'-phosphate synthase/cobalamin synthase